MTLGGHFWTVAPAVRHLVWPRQPPPSRPWSLEIRDPDHGGVLLRGAFHPRSDATAAVILVHGLGGSPESHYCVSTAAAAHQAGYAVLRLGLRGSGRSGADLYHGALSSDLSAALASPELASFSSLAVVGFSFGGHLALHLATHAPPRLRAVIAVCAPLSLARSSRAFDEPRRAFYRREILRSLVADYAVIAAQRPMPAPVDVVREVKTIRAFDTLAIAPRFGFRSADDYYEAASVAPRLGDIHVPTLAMWMHHDPIVPAATIMPVLDRALPLETAWFESGGHVGAPPVGFRGRSVLEHRILTYLKAHLDR